MPNIEMILQSPSDEHLHAQLELLLSLLSQHSSRAEAARVLHGLAHKVSQLEDAAGLQLHTMEIPGVSRPIKLLLTKAVFRPEYWGQTFAEGLLKAPELFDGKRVVELGTGSGWISLLLLQRTAAQEILGLDINPVAVLLANVNKWLNGTTEDGELVMTLFGRPLVDSFKAEVSDLLSVVIRSSAQFEHVVGCIPQVLHPHPEKLHGGGTTTQDLYDLSNYCFQQGILEDRFGLPLIARAIEEAQICMTAGGCLTLILGGRPGTEAVEEMFRRRGYQPELCWVRRIPQADDTDLAQLVNLEKLYGIKFHFFLSESSRQSVPAETAVFLQKQGKRVYHDLLVYRAKTLHERPVLSFVRGLHTLQLGQIRKEMDFSRCSEEQISFLSRLVVALQSSRTLPYPHERGDMRFREKLARFLQIYCHYPVTSANLFISPDRRTLVSMILHMVAPTGSKVLVSESLNAVYVRQLEKDGLVKLVGNDDLTELLQLDRVFQPALCLISPHQLNEASPLVLDSLIQHARANPSSWYVIDDSSNFEIASKLNSNHLLRLPGMQDLPPNLVFLYGLIKNVVYPDFELSFLINAPAQWLEGLEVAAELTYSRISYVVQLYYEWLFDELLSFTLCPAGQSEQQYAVPPQSPLSTPFKEIAQDPVFQPEPVDVNKSDVIRLDYGEFEYPVPDLLLKGLLKGFLQSRADGLTQTVANRIASYMKRTRHAALEPNCLVPTEGVFPLFGPLVYALEAVLGRPAIIGVPRGTYGPVFPCLRYHGASVVLIDTDESQGFVCSPHHLEELKIKPDLIWLSQPGNPSGIYMEPDRIRKLVRYCTENEIYIFSDEIFFLLSDLSAGSWTPAELSFAYNLNDLERRWVFVADGLSKAFAAGGMRCGFIACPDERFARKISEICGPPPQPVLRAWDNLYCSFMEESPHGLLDPGLEREALEIYLRNARRVLSQNRKQLLEILEEFALGDNLPYARRGGLFLLARLGDRTEALARQERILINSSGWSRTPGWSRICFSVEPAKFNVAMGRLSKFLGSNKRET